MYFSLKYTDKMPDWQGGYAFLWFIRLRVKYKTNGDVGLLKHELYHVRQFWDHPFTSGLRYQWSKKYRLQCEVEAYSEQLRWPPASDDTINYRRHFARFIATRYKLDVTEDEAYRRLQ